MGGARTMTSSPWTLLLDGSPGAGREVARAQSLGQSHRAGTLAAQGECQGVEAC